MQDDHFQRMGLVMAFIVTGYSGDHDHLALPCILGETYEYQQGDLSFIGECVDH